MMCCQMAVGRERIAHAHTHPVAESWLDRREHDPQIQVCTKVSHKCHDRPPFQGTPLIPYSPGVIRFPRALLMATSSNSTMFRTCQWGWTKGPRDQSREALMVYGHITHVRGGGAPNSRCPVFNILTFNVQLCAVVLPHFRTLARHGRSGA